MASKESSSSVSDVRAGENRSFLFEIDLNEIPSSPSSENVLSPFHEAYEVVRITLGNPKAAPGGPAELPSELRNESCVCGRVEARGGVVICDGCEKWFHISCAGMRSRQAVVLEDWACGACLKDGVGSKRWPLGFVGSKGSKGNGVQLLDINALPPSDGEGETSDELQYQQRMYASDENPSSSSLVHSNLWNSKNGFDLQRGSNMITQPVKLCFDGLMHNKLTMSRSFEESDLSSHSGGMLRVNNANTKLRRKELARLSRANTSAGKQEIYRSSCGGGFSEVILEPGSSTFEVNAKPANIGTDPQQLNAVLPVQYQDFVVLRLGEIDTRTSYHTTTQIWPVGYQSSWHDKITGSVFTCDVLDGGDVGPVFKVKRIPCSLSLLGSAILLPTTCQLEANCKFENDTVTASGIGYDEDATIQMYLSEPDLRGQDLLSCLSDDLNESYKGNGLPTQPSTLSEKPADVLVETIGSRDEIGEFCVEGRSSLLVWAEVSEKLVGGCCEIFKKSGTLNLYCKHESGKIDSSSMYKSTDVTLGSLTKFCSSLDPFNIPPTIRSVNELDASCMDLSKWLKQDRFGLDLEYVQELIEQLPGAHCCSAYEFLNKRRQYSISQTAGIGLLTGKRKSESQGEEDVVSDKFTEGFKRPRKQGFLRTHEMDAPCRPQGKPLSSRLSAELVGDVLQVWEFLWKFCEILGIKEPLSFEELEEELVNPWPDGSNFLEKIEKEIQENKTLTIHESNDVIDLSTPPQSGELDTIVPGEKIPTFLTMETGPAKEAAQARLASRTYYKCTGVSLTKVHSSLLNVLVGELQARVAPLVDPNFDTGESKSRRGRKKDIESSPMKKSKVHMLPLNGLTWPELARRYILVVLSMDCNLDYSDITNREGGKVFRCLQGDGGVFCGALTGVAGMEADALLLAEATKQICGSLKRDNDIWHMLEEKDTDVIGTCDSSGANGSGIPEWARPLEPVRKLPTNVGTRIRKCVYEALDKDPPDWARKILEHSISKEVYKGNASGPTKKAVLSVLTEVCGEGPQQKPAKGRKGKGVKTISDIITRQCRCVLRRSASADESRTFCNLLGTTSLDLNDNDDEGILGSPAMVSRPLDFRTIDLRLAVGYYGGSHEAFAEDVREVWYNIHIAYGDRPELIQLADTLSRNFESLYEKEVLTIVQKCREHTNPESSSAEVKKELIGVLNCKTDIPKAPWDEGVCKVCGIDRDDESVLLCDTCDSEYHTYCLIPPLARIPEGNWYCPSCVAGQGKTQEASKHTKVITRRRQKRYQGEDSRSFLDALNRLVVTMGEKDYWDFSVEERIFLLKFLCDEVLNSAIIREHLDRCSDISAELQPKLRSLTIELRNMKFKEEALATRSTKDNIITFDGEAGRDKIATATTASALTNHGRYTGHRQTLNNKCSYQTPPTNLLHIHDHSEENKHLYNNCNGGRTEYTKAAGTGNEIRDETSATDDSLTVEQRSSHAISIKRKNSNGEIDYPLPTKEKRFDGSVPEINIQYPQNSKYGFDAGTDGQSPPHEVQRSCLSVETKQANFNTNGTGTPMNSENLFHNHYSIAQTDIIDSETPNLEAISLKNEISLLADSIASIEAQLLKVSLRREFLGRDSSGRLYWVLSRPEKCPWLVVDGSMPALKNSGNEANDLFVESSGSRGSIPFNSETVTPRGSAAFNLDGNEARDNSCHDVRFFPSCVFYDSDVEIQALVGWLKDNDPRERDLAESILQVYKLRSQSSQQAGNHVLADSRASSSNDEATVPPKSLFTKATAILEKSYGPCLEPEPTDVPKKRGRKAKVIHEDRLYRCECLEPIWPSRQHCFSCHQTFCTSLELEEHNEGKCNSAPPVPDECKENDDPVRGKAIMRSEDNRGGKRELEVAEVLKSEKFDVSSKLINFQKEEMPCPYNIEEISRKFITKDSNKELAKEIGLLSSNGVPSFVYSTSPYIHDPTLILYPAQRVQPEGSVIPTTLVVDSSQGKFRVDTNINHTTVHSPKRNGVKEASQSEVSKADYKLGKGPLSFITPDMDAGIVPMSALRPLAGKASQILRRLKINLLDIDAVLPDEAFRPTKAHSSNRRAWRAFIKSADSILEMVKAAIVFEYMLKTEYLRSGWWYWSSLSAAARTSTVSSLALRIYALDAAIMYEKTPLGLDECQTPENLKLSKKRKGGEGLGRNASICVDGIQPELGRKEKDSRG